MFEKKKLIRTLSKLFSWWNLKLEFSIVKKGQYVDTLSGQGTLISTLKEAKPTIFFGVPRVWEKVKQS